MSVQSIPSAAALVLLASAFAIHAGDEVPPTVLQREPLHADGSVRLRVEVLDPSGAGTVTAHVRRAGDTDFSAVPMTRASGSIFEVDVERPAVDDPWIVYYFEATDAAGNGPASNGNRASPFVERFTATTEATAAPVASARNVGVGSLLAGVALLVLLLHLQRRGDRSREQQFWIELLGPVSALRGADLDLAIEQLAARGHYHPVQGDMRVDAATAKRQLARLSRSHAGQLEAVRQRDAARRTQPPVQNTPRAPSPLEGLEEELFWYRVLSPLLERSGPSLESELRALAGRSLQHPKYGRRYFDVPTLRTHLTFVRDIDADDLMARASVDERGTSLIEMLVVLALIAIVLGAVLVSLMPLVAPVQRAADQIDGLMRQARAGAMATIHVHRVRPLDADSLIVETARSCASGAWSLDERMKLDFDGGVTLSDTAWSVCFDGRGLASNTVDLTLLHETLPPQQLELLRGGMLRWI